MTKPARILCPTDFSEASDHALFAAIAFAERLGAELHVMHAYQLPIFVDPDGAVLPGPDLRPQMSADAKAALDRRAEKLGDGVHLIEHLTEGVAYQEIDRVVEEIGADMVILGTHGRTGFKRFLLGSVSEKVVRTCPVPVITVPSGDDPPGGMLKNVRSICCPVDFSPPSEKAVAYALELARALGVEQIELVHVFQLPVTFVSDAGPLIDVEMINSLRGQRAKELEAAVAKTQKLAGEAPRVSGELLEGVDYASIVAHLEESDHDLVVMATHGRGMVAHFLLGSVAERVVRTSPLPVCTVRVKKE